MGTTPRGGASGVVIPLVIENLRATTIFSAFPAADPEAVGRFSRIVSLAPDEVLRREDDPCSAISSRIPRRWSTSCAGRGASRSREDRGRASPQGTDLSSTDPVKVQDATPATRANPATPTIAQQSSPRCNPGCRSLIALDPGFRRNDGWGPVQGLPRQPVRGHTDLGAVSASGKVAAAPE
jgi:hypothetical protein